MFLRNLMSMDTEEMVRAQPCDAVVLIGGSCPVSVALFRLDASDMAERL